MRRLLAIAIALVFCLSLLASCNSDSGNNASNAPDNNPSSAPSSSANTSTSPAPPTGVPVPTAGLPEMSAAPGVKYKAELDIISNNNKITVINPTLGGANQDSACWVFNMIYDKLVVSNGDGTYTGVLAKSWETTDYKTFTLKLRDDVSFHNGEKLTAADFIYTIDVGKESVGMPVYDIWGSVQSATAADPYTLVIVLEDVDVDFFYRLSLPQAVVINEKAIQADPIKGYWIGTGCWKIEDFSESDYVKFIRNDDYWGPPAITERITLRYVEETSARLIQLLNGDCDICFMLEAEDIPKALEDPAFELFNFINNNIQYIGFNMEHPVVSDLNFRMAVASALDRQEMATYAFGIVAVPDTEGTFYGYQTEFRNHDIPIVPYDLDAAKEYLAASPYKGETLEIASAIITNILAAEVIQQQLRKIGIETDIKTMDPPSMAPYAQYGSNQSTMVVYVGPQSLSASSYRNLIYPESYYNRTSYNNPVVNEMLDRARTVTDVNERSALYKEIQEIVAQDPPYLSLFWLMSPIVGSKDIGGMVLSADSYFDLRYIYRTID